MHPDSADYGEPVAIAIKHDGDSEAYADAKQVYYGLPGPLKHRAVVLPGPEYEVTVRATAGEVFAEETFVLRNEGRPTRD